MEKGEKILSYFIRIFSIVIIICTLEISLIRLFYSAELTDVAYAVAENYLVAEGGLPFINNWSLYITACTVYKVVCSTNGRNRRNCTV